MFALKNTIYCLNNEITTANMVETGTQNSKLIINEGEILSFMPNEIYIVNEPLMFLRNDSNENMNSENRLDFEEILIEDSNDEIIPSDSHLPENNREGLAVLEILSDMDQPEFIDINNFILTEADFPTPILTVDLENEDDDDVVFVGEYHQENSLELKLEDTTVRDRTSQKNKGAGPRRNPVRKARRSNTKRMRDEAIFEEDFGILDSSDDEIRNCINRTASVEDKEETQESELMRSWPVDGLHERPEYNCVTKKIEKFDYTIREIQKSVVVKKPKIESVKKQPVKKIKYVPKRKKKTKANIVVKEKVNIKELNDIVSSTLDCVKMFLNNSRQGHQIIASREILNSYTENKENKHPNEAKLPSPNSTKKFQDLMTRQASMYALIKKASSSSNSKLSSDSDDM